MQANVVSEQLTLTINTEPQIVRMVGGVVWSPHFKGGKSGAQNMEGTYKVTQ